MGLFCKFSQHERGFGFEEAFSLVVTYPLLLKTENDPIPTKTHQGHIDRAISRSEPALEESMNYELCYIPKTLRTRHEIV